ncbi:hypothetical protein [Brachyspira sp.]|uniref:hypothetical protein n=1 Tax=Brachyspira sp. TaxID=1977261 RepID=UPI00261A8350|nr:hypothetical protein [Brachyspira sp.]
MKDKNYASFIITKIGNKKSYDRLENYILNKFEYSEIILLFNEEFDMDEIHNTLSPKSDNILCLNIASNTNEDSMIRAGLEFSKGDLVFVLKDIDIDNIENYLDRLYEYNKKVIDISFLVTKYNNIRDNIILKSISLFSGTKLDNIYDIIFFVTRRVINSLSENKSKIVPISYIIRNIGYKYEYINCNIKKNVYKLTKGNRSSYLLIFSEVVSNITFLLSVFSAIISASVGIYSILLKLCGLGNLQNGWASIMTLLSFCFTLIFFIFSILIRYIGLLSKELENKPNYKVISIIKFQ